MCSGGGSPAPVTPAPAPPPAEPAPNETEIGKLRRDQENAQFNNKSPGDFTRVDRSATGGVRGGAGSTNPTGSGLEM